MPDVDRLKEELQAKQNTSVMQFWQFRTEQPEQSPFAVTLNPGAHWVQKLLLEQAMQLLIWQTVQSLALEDWQVQTELGELNTSTAKLAWQMHWPLTRMKLGRHSIQAISSQTEQ